ncbi:MAG: hypothetical protein K0R48_1476, partial [Gammaproteobacteria bacterium]|nr:hypothetical protein [Gammaproteobacteria bacterium]
NLANKPILNLNLETLQLDCNFTHDLSRVKGNFLLQNLNVNANAKGYLNIPNIQVHIENHRDQGVYLGNETIAIPSIDLSVASMLQFKLQDFNSSFVGSRKQNDISYQMNLAMQNALYNNQNYGPFLFDFQINNLSFKVLAQMEEKIRTYAKERAKQPENTAALQNTLAEDLKNLSPGLIQSNTELALKQLDLSAPIGSIHSQGTVRFPTVPTSTDINALMRDIDLSYHLEISKNLAQSFITDIIDRNIGAANNNIDSNAILGQLGQMGLLRENNGAYNLDINIKQGAFSVNQKPFTPAVLQQLQMTPAPHEVLTPPPAVVAPQNQSAAATAVAPAGK